MKINLMIGNNPLNGYLNIDALAKPEAQDRVAGDISNIDAYVDHNEANELLAINILDFFPLQVRQKILNHWLTKLAHGGTITLSCLDMYEFTRLVSNGQLQDVVQINQAIFGTGQNMWMLRKSWAPIDHTIGMIMTTGQFDIQLTKYEGLYYYITAKRK